MRGIRCRSPHSNFVGAVREPPSMNREVGQSVRPECACPELPPCILSLSKDARNHTPPVIPSEAEESNAPQSNPGFVAGTS